MATPLNSALFTAEVTTDAPQPIHGSAVSIPLQPTTNIPTLKPASPIQNIDLTYLFDAPLNAMKNHADLMEMCLENNNPHAHYIEGMKEYFHNDNTSKGLEHLRRSADGMCDNGKYLYGILMMSRGNMEEGKKYLDTLGWKQDRARVDYCWDNVKESLMQLDTQLKGRYIRNLIRIKPRKRCHKKSLRRRCKRCFYYKQLLKFVLNF